MRFAVHLVHLISCWLLLAQFSLRAVAPLISPSALSPDDTLFAHLRCFELFASVQSSDRARDASKWLGCSERYLHRTERTERNQYEAYKRWINLELEEVESFINHTKSIEPVDNSREDSVYDAFEPLFRNHSDAFFQIFLRDASVLQRMYDDQVNEVARDYEHVGLLSEDAKDYIQQCATNASRHYSAPMRSLAMYGCLLTGAGSDAFKEAFDFREIRSGNLTFTVENLRYSRAEVKQQILALDKQHCNNRTLQDTNVG
uniref:Uncharacterized protein n=1 Tax=Anopheles farauti TaxID=69004 RepID=A0A182Q721_9DIPT